MLGDKLTNEQLVLVRNGLTAIGWTGREFVDIPPDFYPGNANEAMRIRSRQLGEVCLHMFSPTVPPEALAMVLEEWRVKPVEQ